MGKNDSKNNEKSEKTLSIKIIHGPKLLSMQSNESIIGMKQYFSFCHGTCGSMNELDILHIE